LRKFLYQTLFPTNNHTVRHQLGVIIFGSVWFLEKKRNQTEIKKTTETGSNRPVLARFGFLEKKLVQTGLARFFPVFFVWVRFSSVWFFWFQAYKTETEPPVGFFKILIGLIRFFSRFGFFRFFPVFLVFQFFCSPLPPTRPPSILPPAPGNLLLFPAKSWLLHAE
jgi:hypothetical protein